MKTNIQNLNNRKGTNGFENILCPQGINKCERTALILGFLSVDSDQFDVTVEYIDITMILQSRINCMYD